MGKLKKVLIMAGGTGGHVFPGLAVAKKLTEEGIEVSWLGTDKGLEARLVPEAGIPLHIISINGLRRTSWKDLLAAPWRVSVAILQAIKIISHLKPDVVLGMGGFVSGPGGIASWLLRYPLIIHEQNAKPGMTNKWLSRVAKKVLAGFPNTFPPSKNVVITGNPVRNAIVKLPNPDERFHERKAPLRLLVLGGSLGATAINLLIPKALAKMSQDERPIVQHQTGEKNFTQTIQAYSDASVTGDIVPFIVEMDKAYAWADIVLCRAGALTVAELCAAGLGAIFVPYPYAVDDHQTANANFMVSQDAAWLVQQADLTDQKLADLLKELYKEPKKCVAKAQLAYKLRTIDATEQVLKICQEINH